MSHDYTFSGTIDPTSKLYEAWRTAMDIRKFEIELYWKRATYFWTFIGLALAGYGAVLTARGDSISAAVRSDALFAIACVGLVFAVAWYFVNRGSKYWQRNWELQIDFLETKIIGPLYKTVFSDTESRFLDLTSAFPFSVSKINHWLSLFVVVLFVLLAAYATPWCYCDVSCVVSIPKVVISTVAAVFIFLIYKNGRMSPHTEPANAKFAIRRVDISGNGEAQPGSQQGAAR